jgi:hypothetical protein
MRTTITLNEQILRRIKERAALEGTSVSALIARVVQEWLTRAPEAAEVQPFRLITVGQGEPAPEVDLDRSSALLAAEDEARFGDPSSR